MRKSFMNIKNFVDSNVRHKATTISDPIDDDLASVERQFEDLRQLCVETEKRISSMLQSIGTSTLGTYTQNVQASLSNLSQLTVTSPVQSSSISDHQQQCSSATNSIRGGFTNNHHSSGLNPTAMRYNNTCNPTQVEVGGSQSNDGAEIDIRKQHKKLPIVGFLKFLVKSSHKLRQDSLLATTLTHCSQLQAQLTKLYISYERTIEAQCLKPIQQVLETDIPNVIRLRKSFIKAHNDLESVKARYNGASQKQQQQQQQHITAHFTGASYTITQNSTLQANINKLDLLKKELDEIETRFEQAKDTYAVELYTFVCRETELVELFMKFYQQQAEYQAQASSLIHNSLPSLSNTLATTPRRVVFGTPLSEHLKCTGRSVSVLVELCVHLLYSNALNEEGLFRIPGSSIKIKKLKSAINAWFVTLASQNELLAENQDDEISQRQNKTTATHQPTLLAVYSLFKDIVGQRPTPSHQQQPSPVVGGESNHNNSIVQTARDELLSTQANATDSCTTDHLDLHKLVFDVHTVAGLLKLYLRELPEPLLGDALYDQWVESCARSSLDSGKQEVLLNGLQRVVEQLPRANYDTLRLIVRFLHLLTCHHDMNKMTATNLAITLAPSLIWTPKNRQNHFDPTTDNHQQMNDAQVLTMQMSSMGISASLHAQIVENLINHAEQLFPGEVNFALQDLDVEPVASLSYGGGRLRSLTNDRSVKSTSPTGSSADSTSSFSSTSNISNSKKSGSIEGLAVASGSASPLPARPMRPQSVYINHLEADRKPAKPPVPPAPTFRTHSRQASESYTSTRPVASRKPPAPPVPSSGALLKTDAIPTSSSTTIEQSVQPVSLRGTGMISSTAENSTGTLTKTARPTVPPPDRPSTDGGPSSQNQSVLNSTEVKLIDAKGVKNSAGLEALTMIDDVDLSDQTSPVVSLSGDDSSFDNHSFDQSWTDSDKDHRNQQSDSSCEESTSTTRLNEPDLLKAGAKEEGVNAKLTTAADTKPRIGPKPETTVPIKANAVPQHLVVPTKPPRSSSPKTNAPSVTQSTLL